MRAHLIAVIDADKDRTCARKVHTIKKGMPVCLVEILDDGYSSDFTRQLLYCDKHAQEVLSESTGDPRVRP